MPFNTVLPSHVNSGYTYRNMIDARADGIRCIDFYTTRYPHSAREMWMRRMESGAVTCNGVTADAGLILKSGDLLEYHRQPWLEPETPADVVVIYECADFIVFAKPAGLPVLPGGGFLDNTMLTVVRDRCGPELSPVQRLDRGTSGLIVFARNPDAANRLSALFRHHKAVKTYLAVVDPADGVKWPVDPYHEPGKPEALFTEFTRMNSQSADGHPVARVVTNIGRAHHVRRVLACAGLPLLGDPLFDAHGMKLPEDSAVRLGLTGDTGYLLHAWKLLLPDPSDDRYEFTALAPPAYGITE